MTKTTTCSLWFDGLTEPINPGGVMAWGYVLDFNDGLVVTGCGAWPAAPENTNNKAEYYALGCALKALSERPEIPDEVIIRGDSNLVVNQLNKSWACNKPHLGQLRDRCLAILNQMNVKWRAEWIPREENGEADKLSRHGYFNLTGKEAPTRTKR